MNLQEIKRVYPISRVTIKSLKRISNTIDEDLVKEYYIDTFALVSAAYIFLNTTKCDIKALSLKYNIPYGSLIQRRCRAVMYLYSCFTRSKRQWYQKETVILRKYDIQTTTMIWVLKEYCALTNQTFKTITVNDISDDLLILLVKRFRRINSKA